MDSSATTVGTLLFVEAKRASASPSDIIEVEYQAFTAACAYFVQTGIKHIWTMTCVGSRARIWTFSYKSTYLIPFVPAGDGLAERSEYLEISTHGREIVNGLEYIKRHMTPPAELLGMTPSPRPANAPLPAGWHDNEVAQLDAARQEDLVSLPASADAMDSGPDPFTSTAIQLAQDAYDTLGDETSGWDAYEEFQGSSTGQVDAEGYGEAGPSEGHRHGDGRKEMEVKVTRIPHTFKE
ncbi:hypothetical protein VTK26DRAFT_9025 [Humicola hyalothermophila]